MTTIQLTTTETINLCKTCGKSPEVSHVNDCGRSIFIVECCGKSKRHQFLTVAFDGWNFDFKSMI